MSGGTLPNIGFQLMSGLAGIGDAYDRAFDTAQRKTALTTLGTQLQGGDYAGAAQTAFQAGDPGTGIGLLKLGQEARLQANREAFSRDFSSGLGALGQSFGAGDMGVPRQVSGAGPAVPSFLDTSGPDSGYLAGLFRRESGNDPTAQASTSSARGLGQFTRGTWNRVASQNPDLNLTPVGDGQDGRTDPDQMVRATRALTAENEGVLQQSGLPVTDASRYALHFLGAGGGRRLVAGAMRNPDAPAASYANPDQVAANRNVFFNRDGSPKSAGQVMADFGRSFGGSSSAPVRQASTAIPAPVAYADDEAQAQVLEQRMGMMPPVAPQVASAALQADMPAPGAQNASFYVPGGDTASLVPPGLSGGGRMVPGGIPPKDPAPTLPAGGVPSGRVMTMPGEDGAAPQAAASQVPANATIGGQSAAAIQSSPLGQKIPFLMKALASPYIEGGQKELASTLLKQALDETKMPDSVKEFMWARAHGMTQATSPNAYALEKQRSPGADLTSQIRAREAEGLRLGMDPNSDDFRNYTLGYKPTDKDEGGKLTSQIEARGKAAIAQGMQPGTPEYQAYTLTGKTLSEKGPGPTEQRMISDTEKSRDKLNLAVQALQQAQKLSEGVGDAGIYSGSLAGLRSAYDRNAPSWAPFANPNVGANTTSYDNLVQGAALGALKDYFGGRITNYEDQQFTALQPGSGKSSQERKAILDTLINRYSTLADHEDNKLNALREGRYFRPREQGQASNGDDAPRQPVQRQGSPASSAQPADRSAPMPAASRFGQLVGSGMSKAQAYEQMHREGY